MVTNVMSAVCVLLKEPTDWPSIKRVMSDHVMFLRRLTDIDKNQLQDKESY